MKPHESENPLHDEFEVADPLHEPRRPLYEVIVLVMGVVAFIVVLTAVINAVGIPQIQEAVKSAGAFAPLFYILLKTLTYVVAPLTSGPIQMFAGTLFDSVWLGVLYTLIGECLGGSISFWLARRFGRPLVAHLVGKDGMAQVDDFYRHRLGGWLPLAVARLVLFSVWDFLSYAAGLAPVKFRSYLWVSFFVGAIPTYLFVWLGDSVVSEEGGVVMIYLLVALLIALPVLLRKQIVGLLKHLSVKHHNKQEQVLDA